MPKDRIRMLIKTDGAIRQFRRKYDALLASPSIFDELPAPLRSFLDKAGMEPTILTHEESMRDKIAELKVMAKFEKEPYASLTPSQLEP